jgi:tryptophan-rich hypothetical protein
MTLRRTASINPKKLLHSKWTCVAPQDKEKHFVVTRVLKPETPRQPIESVELEAVISKRARVIPWRELEITSEFS